MTEIESVCDDCGENMNSSDTTSCIPSEIFVHGAYHKRDSTYFDYNNRCHDCGIENKEGNYHHFGCDMERCPVCGGQLIGCVEGLVREIKE